MGPSVGLGRSAWTDLFYYSWILPQVWKEGGATCNFDLFDLTCLFIWFRSGWTSFRCSASGRRTAACIVGISASFSCRCFVLSCTRLRICPPLPPPLPHSPRAPRPPRAGWARPEGRPVGSTRARRSGCRMRVGPAAAAPPRASARPGRGARTGPP